MYPKLLGFFLSFIRTLLFFYTSTYYHCTAFTISHYYQYNQIRYRSAIRKTAITTTTTQNQDYTTMMTSAASNNSNNHNNSHNKFQFSIDRGGTFTDIHCILPNGEEIVTKLLSEDPDNYLDAPTEGIRRILSQYDASNNNKRSSSSNVSSYNRNQKVCTSQIHSIRMGTTVATNALLERNGCKTGLIITKGYKDLLKIGNQSRKDIFDLSCQDLDVLYDCVEEIDERVVLSHFVNHNNSNERMDEEKMDMNLSSSLSIKALQTLSSTSSKTIGTTNEEILILTKPNDDEIHRILTKFQSLNIQSIAIVLLHSYTFHDHEQYIASIAKQYNYFTNISLSSSIMPMIKVVSRGHTACAAAYLTPVIMTYISNFVKGFDDDLLKNVRLSFMKSDGGLTPVSDFGGHQAILSGPAGGVVGYAKTAFRKNGGLLSVDSDAPLLNGNSISGNENEKIMPVIGFDMGGTSTDVSRYDGTLELVFETTTAGVAIQAPQLDIHTVAAGGGSRLFLRSGMFYVGPESAGKNNVVDFRFLYH